MSLALSLRETAAARDKGPAPTVPPVVSVDLKDHMADHKIPEEVANLAT